MSKLGRIVQLPARLVYLEVVNIGNNVMIGGQVGIKQHRKIGDNVEIAAGSGVTLSIASNQRVAGAPARKLGTYLSEIKTISRIARK